MRLTLAALALSLVPAALADTPDAKAVPADERCLWADQVDGFQDAGKNSIILTNGNRRWQAELSGPCLGLSFAEKVATVTKMSCVSQGDKIVYEDAGMKQTCFITAIRFLPKEEKPETP